MCLLLPLFLLLGATQCSVFRCLLLFFLIILCPKGPAAQASLLSTFSFLLLVLILALLLSWALSFLQDLDAFFLEVLDDAVRVRDLFLLDELEGAR